MLETSIKDKLMQSSFKHTHFILYTLSKINFIVDNCNYLVPNPKNHRNFRIIIQKIIEIFGLGMQLVF